MITYSDLKNTYHAEKKTSLLSKINNNFYSDAQKLLAQINDSHREHLTEILFEIHEMRKNKIMLGAARSHRPENLISAEDDLYNEIVNKIEKFRKRLLYVQTEIKEKEKIKEEIKKDEEKEELQPEEKKQETTKKLESGKIRVRIIKNIPAIIGSDLKHHELKENDEIEMLAIDAKILIENGIAIRI